MSLVQLRTFVEVHRRRSITGAARALSLTQPAVSSHIASLEAQLDRPLFERHARGVRPTEIADHLAAALGETLDRAEAALAGVKARATEISGAVHLAGPAEFMAERMSGLLHPLVAAGLELRIHTGGRDRLYEMLLSDRADLAFTASRPEDARLAHEAVASERLLAVAAPELARGIATGAELSQALGAAPYLAYDHEAPLIRNWLEENGLPPLSALPAVTAPDLRLIRSMVAGGTGWTVLPDYLCRDAIAAGHLQEIPAPRGLPENLFFLVWAKSALRHPRIAFARRMLLSSATEAGWLAPDQTARRPE